MMKTFKDEVFCPECGANMALGIEKSSTDLADGQYVKRILYLYCPNQGCPFQFKRKDLPEA